MSNFRPINRDTGFLLPPSVDEWLPQRHLARFVVEVIDGLDVSELVKEYRGSGSASYHPAMLLGLLVYGYATKVFSSRAIERATHDSVAFRFIAGNEHPDHNTIAAFRKRFLPQIKALFVQVLRLASTMGMLKMGTVALDGTKVHANASRHSALSYGHAKKIEKQLKREVQQLLQLAARADAQDIPDGMSVPEELERRELRLAAIAEAKVKIEARAEQRLEREQAEHEAKMAARAEQEKCTGKKPPGRSPEPPTGGVRAKDQINLTDEDSRIMKVAGGGFEQCYNAQAVVAAGNMLVVATEVTQAANDKEQLVPMIEKVQALPQELGRAKHILADSGYLSEANVEHCAGAQIEPLIAMGRCRHHISCAGFPRNGTTRFPGNGPTQFPRNGTTGRSRFSSLTAHVFRRRRGFRSGTAMSRGDAFSGVALSAPGARSWRQRLLRRSIVPQSNPNAGLRSCSHSNPAIVVHFFARGVSGWRGGN